MFIKITSGIVAIVAVFVGWYIAEKMTVTRGKESWEDTSKDITTTIKLGILEALRNTTQGEGEYGNSEESI